MRREKNECKSLLCPAAPNKLNQKGGKPPALPDIEYIIKGLPGTIQEKKGEGGHGVVYKVKLDDGGEAAYKFITKATHDLVDDYLEIGILQLITNIQSETSYFPELYDWDFVKSKNILWMGIELVETDLDTFNSKASSIDIIHKISFQIARGLEFLHKHDFAHCDLKPANIGINKDNSIRLLDFGLMQYLHDGTPANGWVVSRWYRPPEISYTYNSDSEKSTYTTTVDMWSLGCIIAEMFMGEEMLQGDDDYINDNSWGWATAHSDEFQINKCIDLCLQLGKFQEMIGFIKEIKGQPHIHCKRPDNTKAEVFEKLSNRIKIRNTKKTVTSMKDILLSGSSDSQRETLINDDAADDAGLINTVLPELFNFNFEERCSATDFLDKLRDMDEAIATSYKPIHASIDPDSLHEFQKCFKEVDINTIHTMIKEQEVHPVHKRLAFAKVLHGGKSPLFKDLDPKITECIIRHLI